MKAAAVLMVSLRSTAASTRWFTMALMVLVLAFSVLIQRHQSSAGTFWPSLVIAAYGELFTGAYLLAPSLLLAIDARQLRLPHVQHHLLLGLIFHAAMWVAIPSLILTLAGGHITIVVASQALGLVTGLTFGLLPRMFVITALFAPTFFSMMKLGTPFPKTWQPSELWVAVAAFIVVCAICWRRQLRMADPYRASFGTASVVWIRLMGRYGMGSGSNWFLPGENLEQIRSRPAWLLAIPALHRSGPHHPIQSLRVVLGGWLMPKTLRSTLVQWSVIALPTPALFGLLYLRFPDPFLAVWHAFSFGAFAWLAGFVSMLLGFMTAMLIQQRWFKASGELSILALLPGLGQGTSLIKNLLRASLLPTLYLQLLIAALLTSAATRQHADGTDLMLAIFAQLAALAFAPAFACAAIGGRALPPWVTGLVVGVSFSLVGIGSGVAAAADHLTAHGSLAISAVIAVWLILLGFLCWLGLRGWRGLRGRPHPFLVA
jgi:hypothetical protein